MLDKKRQLEIKLLKKLPVIVLKRLGPSEMMKRKSLTGQNRKPLKTIFLKVDLRGLNKTQIWRFLPYFFCKQNRSISILKCIIHLFLRLKYHLWMVRHKLTHFFYKMIQKINLKIRNGTHRFTIFIYSKSFNLTYCIK